MDVVELANQAFADSEWDPERLHRVLRVPRYHIYFVAPELSFLTTKFWEIWRPFRFAKGWASRFIAINRAKDAGLLSDYGLVFAKGWVLARPRDPRLPPIAFSQQELSVSDSGLEIVTVTQPYVSVQLPPPGVPVEQLVERLIIFQRIVRLAGKPLQVAMARVDIATGKFVSPSATDIDLGERARLAFAISAGLPVSANWKIIGAKAPEKLARLIASQHPEDLGVPGPWTKESLAAFMVVTGIAHPQLASTIAEKVLG